MSNMTYFTERRRLEMARPTWRVRDEPKLGAGSGHASKDSVGKLERITPLGVRSQPELASESSKRVQTGEPTQFTKMSWRASGPSPSSSCKSIPNPGRRSPHSWTNGSIIRRSGGRLGWPVRKPQMPAFCQLLSQPPPAFLETSRPGRTGPGALRYCPQPPRPPPAGGWKSYSLESSAPSSQRTKQSHRLRII